MFGYSTNGHVDFEPEYKYITGYHGTSHASAELIEKENAFHISNYPKLWLGRGIYFYKYFVDAAKWVGVNPDSPKVEEVFHIVAKVKYDDYLDLETTEGIDVLNAFLIRAIEDGLLPISTPQKNQCALLNMIWDEIPEIQAIGGAFPPSHSSDFKTLQDTRSKRREFCLRDNSNIVVRTRINGIKY